MTRFLGKSALLVFAAWMIGCNGSSPDLESNPLLDNGTGSKEDTGYVNLRGREVEVTFEADIQGGWNIFAEPANLAQFATTYLKAKEDFYLELLAEDANSPQRVDWLVDGQWVGYEAAKDLDQTKLTHFRMREINAVLMGSQSNGTVEGLEFEAVVPIKPSSIMADAGDKCGDAEGHITVEQSVYWYVWNPDKAGCPQNLLQTAKLSVTKVLPKNPESYPEYNKLWEDKKLTVAIFFAKLDEGDVKDDYNWGNFNQFVKWLKDANFIEQPNAPMGKRLSRTIGDLEEVVDVYGPDVFYNVADYGRLSNWQKAVSEHEVIMYNGHSVLGTGMAFEEITYPQFYQIFQVASCLSYEYYVRPILAGKGSWDNVDIISNIEPTYYSENLPLCGAFLGKLFYGFENQGRTSWQDIMEAVSKKLGHARFGVSGARTNCFSPAGDRCNTEPNLDEKRYESSAAVAIPDNSNQGASSVIEVPDNYKVAALKVELDLSHTYVGDLEIVLSHNGVQTTLWNREGDSQDDIKDTFTATNFGALDASGTWTLQLYDRAQSDVGTLNRWALLVTPAK